MQYVLGIDQGASKTAAIVSDMNGNILGTGLSDGTCCVFGGLEYSMKLVEEASGKALAAAGAEKKDIAVLVAGMTGADWPHEYRMFHEAFTQATGINAIKVVNDCIPALRAGTEKNYGVIICAGSALNAAVIDKAGNEFVYGYYIDNDDQGAIALGDKAIREAIASCVGLIRPTVLLDELLGFFHVKDADELLCCYVNKKLAMNDIRDFTPRLFEIAYDGDEVALSIIVEFGRRISRYAVAGIQRFNLQQHKPEVVLSGSIFKNNNPVLLDAVALGIHASVPKAIVKNAQYEPVVGTVVIGLEMLHYRLLTDEMWKNIKDSSVIHGLTRCNGRKL